MYNCIFRTHSCGIYRKRSKLINGKHKLIELLKNSIVEFNKTTSIDSFHTTEIDGELIFQQL
ncbi:hypothetical protein AR546_00265 [Leptospira interrogans serovar Canicola]|nr:hypothetical protein [Leptospira interrogans serovar Canicola]OLZ33160.1 hypothetical protein AR546_00265 [Leptospira interrogans serovar Canicola]OMH68832.1 hypothetical protein BW243_05965 [Leptospira interrogans serovar Pomona]POR13774.1 hypothetical protein B0T34_20800 [Leptospira interrogans serovar Canicola]